MGYRRWTRREEAIALYGARCAHCGYSDARALQFDHVLSDGASERKRCNGYQILRNILKRDGRYQLLCANCNTIKRIVCQEDAKRKAKASKPLWRGLIGDGPKPRIELDEKGYPI